MTRKKSSRAPRQSSEEDEIDLFDDSDDLLQGFDEILGEDTEQPENPAAKKPAKKTTKTSTSSRSRSKSIDPEPTTRQRVTTDARRKRRRARQTADLESQDKTAKKKRPLTKKQKQKLSKWSGKNRHRAVDGLMTSIASAAAAETGHPGMFVASETQTLGVGLPMPSIALEWFFGQNALPLSQLIQLTGRKSVGKTPLVYEMIKWFRECGGGGVYIRNEPKFAWDFAQSIIGHEAGENPFVLYKSRSVQDWQKATTFFTKEFKKNMDGTAEDPGPGRVVPCVIGLDSLVGSEVEEYAEKLDKEGTLTRLHPAQALSIRHWLTTYANQQLDDWPILFVATNHLKTAIGEDMASDRTPGGDTMGFLEATEISLRTWRSSISSADFEGMGILLSSEKNQNAGTRRRQIATRLLWWHEDVPGTEDQNGRADRRQRTIWDWNWSTVAFLGQAEVARKNPRVKAQLKKIGFEVKVKSPKADVGCMANCEAVGMKKGEWLPFSDVGRMIQADENLMDDLRDALDITRRPFLAGDYLDQMDKLADAAIEQQEAELEDD